jgi:hypothetical protein
MKKLVFASLMALVNISLVNAPALRAQAAQDPGQISLPPEQYNDYQTATTQSDPKAKAAALETFLTKYPQTPVKKDILNQLLGAYQAQNDTDNMLSSANRLLQVDPANFQALFVSVYVKKLQCGKTSDPQTCDDAAALAQKGLTSQKPAGTSDDDWKKLTGAAFPIFHSAIAADDYISKKDFKAAEAEYKAELMLYTDAQSQTQGLPDTLLLAQAYSLPGAGQDLVQAVWFYARVWDFAPPAYKAQIEPKLEYYYKKYHGKLDGLDGIKAQAQATTFPPGTFVIPPAPTAAEQIHTMLTDPTTKLPDLALSDKETILAFGSKDDAEKVWAVMKDQQTPVPGIVIEASATVIKVAVTQDAKDAKVADFIVTLKTPLADKDIPAVGFEYGLSSKGLAELDGTYDSYTQIPAKDAVPASGTTPATPATTQSAQIALRDGFVQEKKKVAAPVHHTTPHKPSAAH